MSSSCNEKQKYMISLFASCSDEEARYCKIIELGRLLPLMDEKYKVSENLVKGCQSAMYLRSYVRDHCLFFDVFSEALISAGLAAILVNVYSGETAETVLTYPPSYLEQLGIDTSLTPSRANGLYSIHLKMKQDALKFLMQAK